jgi:hypothetical protein
VENYGDEYLGLDAQGPASIRPIATIVSDLIAAPTEGAQLFGFPGAQRDRLLAQHRFAGPCHAAARLRCCRPVAFVVVRCAYASAQILPPMYATAQNLLLRTVMLEKMKVRAKVIVQNVSVRTDKGSVDCIDAFRDQMKRGRK